MSAVATVNPVACDKTVILPVVTPTTPLGVECDWALQQNLIDRFCWCPSSPPRAQELPSKVLATGSQPAGFSSEIRSGGGFYSPKPKMCHGMCHRMAEKGQGVVATGTTPNTSPATTGPMAASTATTKLQEFLDDR